MSDPIVFEQLIQGELPFTLNIPDGVYTVKAAGGPYEIEILQGRLAVAADANSMLVGTADDLRARLGDRWDSAYKHELRTIVRHQDRREMARADLPMPDDDQLFVAAQRYLMRHTPTPHSGPPAIQQAASEWLAGLTDEARAMFTTDTGVRLAAASLFHAGDVEYFCRAVNALARLYMATFNDRFVGEVTEQHFSGTAFHGVRVSIACNGHHVESTHHVGGYVPNMIRRPWLQLDPAAVESFRTRLQNDPEPDPVTLLCVRARALVIRGGFRSALIEASAALDLCLVRKIRSGFAAQGKNTPEIDEILAQQENLRFDQRAKKVLKEATGQSAADLDPPLWQRVVAHRRQRGSVAHAATEPTEAEATAAVDDMIRLVRSIEGIA